MDGLIVKGPDTADRKMQRAAFRHEHRSLIRNDRDMDAHIARPGFVVIGMNPRHAAGLGPENETVSGSAERPLGREKR